MTTETLRRTFRLTVVVEEVTPPKETDDAPNSKAFWREELEEFFDEGDR
jgi:hypothetical protein